MHGVGLVGVLPLDLVQHHTGLVVADPHHELSIDVATTELGPPVDGVVGAPLTFVLSSRSHFIGA